MKICINCKHHKNVITGKSTTEPATWFNHVCLHPKHTREETVDPVVGQPCFKAVNDLGKLYFTDLKHPFCKDINTDAACSEYSPKEAQLFVTDDGYVDSGKADFEKMG